MLSFSVTSRGVLPNLSLMLTFAPSFSSNDTVSFWSLCAARYRAVIPSLSVTSTSIPSASNCLISSVLPRVATSQFFFVADFHLACTSCGVSKGSLGSSGEDSGGVTGLVGDDFFFCWASVGTFGLVNSRRVGSVAWSGVADYCTGCAPHPKARTAITSVIMFIFKDWSRLTHCRLSSSFL